MTRHAVYPGTFDPIHNGHVDIARRAARVFDRLTVAVYDRPSTKRLLFPIQQRIALAREALAHVDNVVVTSYSGLTVDFCRQVEANVIVRGLRVISDFEFEFQMSLMNHRLDENVEFMCLMTSLEYAFLSSTIVKEVALLGGDINSLVPPNVQEALQTRLASQPNLPS